MMMGRWLAQYRLPTRNFQNKSKTEECEIEDDKAMSDRIFAANSQLTFFYRKIMSIHKRFTDWLAMMSTAAKCSAIFNIMHDRVWSNFPVSMLTCLWFSFIYTFQLDFHITNHYHYRLFPNGIIICFSYTGGVFQISRIRWTRLTFQYNIYLLYYEHLSLQ